MKCEIVYYHHSGFTAATDDTLLVFDYWEGNGALPIDKRLTPLRLNRYKQVFVFTSHAHPDHMDPVVYTWQCDVPVTYITSFDTAVGVRGRRMWPGDEMPLADGVRVKAFGSTDTGVSYLVNLNGIRIFHAGDLNLWHWREESSLREIEAAEKAFDEAVAPIAKEKVDIAMFPVDPRQGQMFDAGANLFILRVKPKVFIPMHWQNRPEVAIEYARRATNKQTGVFALVKPREKLVISFEDDVMTIEVFNQKEMPPARDMQKEEPQPENEEVPYFTKEDPFLESDLPVNIETTDEARL
jgi:hypothetical protein